MKTILLIEDDSVVRENTAELLGLANYHVITAANGKIGVNLAKKHVPDIIICDIMMPELNGYGVLQILSKETLTQQIPFIFLSAKTEHKDVRKGMNMGADDYITKPFDESELFSAIESRLAKMAILNEKRMGSTTKKQTNYVADDGIKTLHQLKNYFSDESDEQHFNAGEIIYHQGDNSNYVYLILKGIVKTYKIDEQGKELITELLKEDDFFGFTSFTQNITYQEFAAAIEDTKVSKIATNDLKLILHNNHDLTLELFDYLSDNVTEIKEHLLEMAYSSVRKKTASTILQFSEKIKKTPNICVQILRSDLASIAGIATETFIRTLSDFKKEGLIDVDGRNIKILNIEKLKRIN
jgi:DNA-binding response OmpR family regulator